MRQKYLRRGAGITALGLAGLLIAGSAAAAPGFDCARQRCGLQGDGAYPHLVIGTLQHIGQGKDSEQVFRWARKQGWWQPLPDDARRFAQTIRPVSLRTQSPAGPVRITSLMGDDEFQTAPLQVGDLVRYSPHDENHTRPKIDTPAAWAYWNLIGCIQVLCRVQDKACMSRYRQGVYDRKSGVALEVGTRKPITGGPVIDPVSYLPKTIAPKQP